MRKIFLVSCCLLLGIAACGSAVVHEWEEQTARQDPNWHEVQEVISGDTIRLRNGQVVRYLGIQAPRQGEPWFKEARDANAWLLRRGKVLLLNDDSLQDAQGYSLAYAFAPAKGIFCFVNEELLQYGYAKVSDFPVAHKYVKNFRQLEAEARQARACLWSVVNK